MNALLELDRRVRRWNENRKATKEIVASLPEAIDLWSLVLQAGLDFQVALDHYLTSAPHDALWRELSTLQTEIRTGIGRAQALRNLAHRADEPNLKETARVLLQGVELGSSLAPILRAQGHALRKRRAYAAEKQAAMAPLKLLFPLLVFIFPTMFVIFFVPMALQMSQSPGIFP
jgi:tight adherence protein C